MKEPAKLPKDNPKGVTTKPLTDIFANALVDKVAIKLEMNYGLGSRAAKIDARELIAIVNNDGVLAEIRGLAEDIYEAITRPYSTDTERAMVMRKAMDITTLCTPPPPSLRDEIVSTIVNEYRERFHNTWCIGYVIELADKIMDVIKEATDE